MLIEVNELLRFGTLDVLVAQLSVEAALEGIDIVDDATRIRAKRVEIPLLEHPVSEERHVQ